MNMRISLKLFASGKYQAIVFLSFTSKMLHRFGQNAVCQNLQLNAVPYDDYAIHIRQVHRFSEGSISVV